MQGRGDRRLRNHASGPDCAVRQGRGGRIHRGAWPAEGGGSGLGVEESRREAGAEGLVQAEDGWDYPRRPLRGEDGGNGVVLDAGHV